MNQYVIKLKYSDKNNCLFQVTGVVTDSNGVARWVLQGTWDEKVEGAKVIKTIETGRGKTVYETGPTKVMWERKYPPYVSLIPVILF